MKTVICEICEGKGEYVSLDYYPPDKEGPEKYCMTDSEIEIQGNKKVDVYCEECSYEVGYVDFRSAVFKINMHGGYFMFDGEGGSETKCPECGKDSLTTSD